jgi:hypothetical protein
LFSHNRFNLLSFHDRDHGPKDGSPLRPWIDGVLGAAGVDISGGAVRILCYPRVMGYVFNPLSLWFCHHRDGSLRAVLCEVRNTFGEWHGYLLHRDGRAMRWPVQDSTAKVFHVSPFLPLGGHYDFRIGEPGQCATTTIRYTAEGDRRPSLVAVQTLHARELTDAAVLRCVAAMPLMTLKVILAIHWHALRLWLRGARFHRKPVPPAPEVTR